MTTKTSTGIDYETDGLTLYRGTYKKGPRARKIAVCPFYARDAAGASRYINRGGTVHTDEEIQRVQTMLATEIEATP